MKMNEETVRDFSESMHSKNHWQTRSSKKVPWIFLPLWRFISFKREGVYRLAKIATGLVLDAGCGGGAYAEWFMRSNKSAKIVAADISFLALIHALETCDGKILPVCCDLHHLPFKPRSFDAAYSIDTLGHLDKPEFFLDELSLSCKEDSPLFLHAECTDALSRWPDKKLIEVNGRDLVSELDGHIGAKQSPLWYAEFRKRFTIEDFFSPAGLSGWLTGYPEKYRIAFKAAGMNFLFVLCTIAAFKKRLPVIGYCFRFVNSCINWTEHYFGICGGGSCFAKMRTTKARPK